MHKQLTIARCKGWVQIPVDGIGQKRPVIKNNNANKKREVKIMKPNYIVCIVDPTDNSYDYELDGLWTDNITVVDIWVKAGIQYFVLLDPLSLALIASYDNDDMRVYVDGILDDINN